MGNNAPPSGFSKRSLRLLATASILLLCSVALGWYLGRLKAASIPPISSPEQAAQRIEQILPRRISAEFLLDGGTCIVWVSGAKGAFVLRFPPTLPPEIEGDGIVLTLLDFVPFAAHVQRNSVLEAAIVRQLKKAIADEGVDEFAKTNAENTLRLLNDRQIKAADLPWR
jgi:hypothetical protein